jgi:hypothetical protein
MNTSYKTRRPPYRHISPTFWAGTVVAAVFLVATLIWLLTHGAAA